MRAAVEVEAWWTSWWERGALLQPQPQRSQMQQVQQMQQQLLMLMPQQGLMLGAMQQLPPGGQPPQQSAPDSPSARLSKLDEYKQRGIITAEEHADQRAKIISALGI